MLSYHRNVWMGALSAAFIGALVLLTGCGLGSPNQTVTVRVVDAVSSSTALDFAIGGSTFVSSENFKDVTTYGFVSNGSNDLEGFSTGSSNTVIQKQTVTLDTNNVYTILAAGIIGSTINPPMFFIFTDNNTLPPRNMIRVRAINASPDAGPVDVSIGSQVIATNLGYGANSDYTVTNAGGTSLSVVKTGTTTPVATIQTKQALISGHVFTILLEGQVIDGSVAIIAQEDV